MFILDDIESIYPNFALQCTKEVNFQSIKEHSLKVSAQFKIN